VNLASVNVPIATVERIVTQPSVAHRSAALAVNLANVNVLIVEVDRPALLQNAAKNLQDAMSTKT